VGNIHYEKGEDKMIFNNVVDIRIWECYKSPKHVIERMDEVNSTGKNDRAAAWAFLRTGPGWGFNGLSPKAFRANAYAAVISGAKGILYFEMRTSRWSGHELWPDVFKKVSEEIQSLATSFMKESSQEIDLQIIEGAKLSRAKAWKDGNKIYLAIVNANENKDQMKIKFPLAVKGSGKALFEDMPDAKLEDEYISVNLEPEDVGVYTLSEK
jgi:hypothetical protein